MRLFKTQDVLNIQRILRMGKNAVLKVTAADGTESTVDLTELGVLDGLTATAAELNILDGATLTVSELNQLDGNLMAALATGAGTGITGGTGTVYASSVLKAGDFYHTRILIDVTGLDSDATLGDIIGVSGTTNPCHLGQVTAAESGTVAFGLVTCLEAPATGEIDIDLYSADEATGVTDDAISGLTNGTALMAAATDWTAGTQIAFSGVPAADQYLYLTVGTSSSPAAGTYTAGKFLIEMWGT